MLNIVRRGPASIARSLTSIPTYSSCSKAADPRSLQRCVPRTSLLTSKRQLVALSQWRRSTTAAAAMEDEAVEEEIEQEVHSQHPPSDAQINQATEHGPVTKFKELAQRGMVCKTVVDTITRDMGLETMTPVQSLTINESLKGIDVLAQARTGTGKTLAFLIPVLQNIINYDPKLEKRSRIGRSGASTDIRAIIISPTRELAEQIAVEAKKVSRNTGVIVQTAVGGTMKSQGLRKIQHEGCHILVGTPGRLNDILSDPYSRVRAPNLSAFVLDEADRLLDQGFAPDIEEIKTHLPQRRDVDRQTLLYSATVPREIMQIVRSTMKPDFKFVRTVQEGEQQTHERVTQKLVNVGGFENLMPALVELCKREINHQSGVTGSPARPFKAIVYFSATAEVALAASVLNNLRNEGESIVHQSPLHPAKVIEIHARLTQAARTKAADSFRRAQSAILLSSDVTARGMDFPNVTHVIQIGLPPSQEQYIHRIGRTARGDKTGEGWILVTRLEAREIRHKLPKMPLEPDNTLETAQVDMKKDAQVPEHVARTLTQVANATKMVPGSLKVSSYMAGLGVFSWVSQKQKLVDALNDRAKYGWGMSETPGVSYKLLQRLNLTRVEGINVSSSNQSDVDEGRGSSMGRSSYGSDRRGGSGRSGGYSRGGLSSFGGRDSGRGGGGNSSSFVENSDWGDRGAGGYGGSRGGRGGYSSSFRENSDRSDRGASGSRGGRGGYSSSFGENSDRGDRGAGGSRGGRGGYGRRGGRERDRGGRDS